VSVRPGSDFRIEAPKVNVFRLDSHPDRVKSRSRNLKEPNLRTSAGGWFERSETFKYLGQLLPTFLEKLFPEMI
jgi:hypothetical protein